MPFEKGQAPKVTEGHIESLIIGEHYFTANDGVEGAITNQTYAGRFTPDEGDTYLESLKLMTFCVLVLRNGFVVTGSNTCVSPGNFDADLGRKYARENALEQIWPLEGYLIKQKLSEEG